MRTPAEIAAEAKAVVDQSKLTMMALPPGVRQFVALAVEFMQASAAPAPVATNTERCA